LLCLRIAALVHRRRAELDVSDLVLGRTDRGYALAADEGWLAEHPLTEFNLRQESAEWAKIGVALELV
jgi:exopolyphosphatase/guanosine-5'-triphosphate,3'-diphosphate pyrophosphatase